MERHPAPHEQRYRDALAAYLDAGNEALLARAYELGRDALEEGCSIPDMVGVHQRSLHEVLPGAAVSRPPEQVLDAAGDFLAEALSPFDKTHRGYRDSLVAWRHINESFEKEVGRIAHALHDESGQLLVSLHLQLSQLAREMPAAQPQIQQCQALLDRTEQQLRQLSHELRPMVLDDLGWLSAIEFLAAGVAERSGIPIEVRSSVTQRLPDPVETALYRVVQEALANATRHARPGRIRVEIDQDQDCLRGIISDDGVGFEVEPRVRNGGLGLRGMRERLGALGGSLQVVSALGRGTEIRFRLPMRS